MTSNISSKEWLERNIEDEDIRFYSLGNFTDIEYIDAGEYGDVTSSDLDQRNRYLMVFEYADGGSLLDYLSNPSVELVWPTRCKLGMDIASGLGYLHEQDILHKDLVNLAHLICTMQCSLIL